MNIAVSTKWLFLILFLTILAYFPGLDGGFFFDDIPNIVDNQKIHIDALSFSTLKDAALSLNAGPLMRPISFLSFAVNYYFSGLNPFYFKATNLFIHLASGWLIFWLTQLLLAAYRQNHAPSITDRHITLTSLTVAALWLLHPMNLSSVLYVVQRMASLSAFFVFAGLALYAKGRLKQLTGNPGWLWICTGIFVCGPLAIFTKENGALLPFLMFVIEAALFQFQAVNTRTRKQLWIFFGIFAVIPAITICAYLLTHIDWLNHSYIARNFSLGERLMTETRVVWIYLLLTLIPNISKMGLYHDDIEISTSLLSPISTSFALTGILCLLMAATIFRKRAPLISLGILFFLVGHSMESTVFSLEIAHEHRNYLPMFGILLPCVFYLTQATDSLNQPAVRRAVATGLVILMATATTFRAGYWGDWIQFAIVEANNHPHSARSQYQAGYAYRQLMEHDQKNRDRLYSLARSRFEASYKADTYNHSGLFALIELNSAMGKPLDERWIDQLTVRLRDAPMAQFTAASLARLNQCQVQHRCQVSPQIMNTIFSATFANPTIDYISKATLLAEATIQALTQGDYASAVDYARRAVDSNSSEPQHWLNLISVLTQAGHFEEAEKTLQEFKQRGVPQFYANRLLEQEQTLSDKLQKARQHADLHSIN